MILSEKHLFTTTGPSFAPSPSMLLHALKYWCVSVYTISVWDICLRRMNKQDVMVVQPCSHLKNKQTKKTKSKPKEMGWGDHPVLGSGPQFAVSLSVPCHGVFVCHLLGETCSAADFTPSPSALPPLNTSPRLWFITTLLLSPNPLVMLPVLATPKIEDLSPRSRL